jgi:hypothetical protein
VQNLSFSSYGPNNLDSALQTRYFRTADDAYIQSLPNGKIISFKVENSDSMAPKDSELLWGHTFHSPVYVPIVFTRTFIYLYIPVIAGWLFLMCFKQQVGDSHLFYFNHGSPSGCYA